MDEHSFVVLAYKDSPFLEECLNSLKTQTIKSKIIIVTSTPSVFIENIAKKFQIEVKINLRPNGIAGDWNFALHEAPTNWVTLAHQDDIYHPSFASTTINALNKQPNLSLHFTNASEKSFNNTTKRFTLNTFVKSILLIPFSIQNPLESSILKKMVLAFGNPICCPTVTYNKTVLKQFSFRENYSYVLDWMAWIDIFKLNAPVAYNKAHLLTHRIHEASATVGELKKGVSKKEETLVLEKFWGKTLTKIIYFFYQIAHLNHKK